MINNLILSQRYSTIYIFVLILALLSECSPTAQIVTVVELGELQDIEN